jgi:PAS domain S-box-containing protein
MSSQRGGVLSSRRGADDTSTTRFAIAAVLLAVLVGVFAVVLLTQDSHPRTQEWFSNVVTVVAAAAVPVTAQWASRRSSARTQVAWRLMAAAGVLWTAGEVVWLLENYVFLSAAEPALSDLCYLLALVPAAAALLVLPPPLASHGERLRVLLTAAVVSGSVLFVTRSLVLSVIPASSEGWAAWGVALAYPMTDVVLASLALIVLVRVGSTARLHLFLLSAGFLVYSVSDALYVRLAATDAYVSGSALDLGWVAGYALFALAPLAPRAGHEAAAPQPRVDRPGSYDWSALALYSPSIRPDPLLIGIGLATLVVFALRQALLAGDHRRLRLDLQTRVGELEARSAQLRQLASENEGVIASVVDGIFGVNASGRVSFVNPPAERMLGRSATELIGSFERDLFQPASPVVSAALVGGTSSPSVRAGLRRGDGSVFPVELAVGPIREGTRVVGAVVVFRDVSARLAVEKMKNEFVSVVSHELRTPLTSIRGSLGLLHSGLGGDLSARGDRMVSIALESSERLSRLIEDMLDLERMESGSLTMLSVTCEIRPLVRTALDEVDSMARKHGVRLQVDEVDGLVLGDPDRIVQVLTNLLGNSIKFSPRDSSVRLSTSRHGDLVEFAVEDRGRGIPGDRLGRIFERFEQVDSSDSRERGGTGLGLSITRDIVELHGGTIWVDSELGRGSTFRFTLPGTGGNPVSEPSGEQDRRSDLDGVVG